jgi:hypothetical protein
MTGVTPIKAALTALADALAKRPAEEILRMAAFWTTGRRTLGHPNVGIPTCKPGSMRSTRSIWPSSAKSGGDPAYRLNGCARPRFP